MQALYEDPQQRFAATWELALSSVQRWRNQGEKIVFTNGCFDLLHRGHIHYLSQARSLGDRLVVGLNTDASVRRLKGAERPINSELDRAYLLAALRAVDLVVRFEQDTPLELIKCLQPDILVKGGDYTPATIVGANETLARGGQVLCLPFVDKCSSSAIISRIRNPAVPPGS